MVGNVKVDGMFEAYNLFNHENYGSYMTNASARSSGSRRSTATSRISRG